MIIYRSEFRFFLSLDYVLLLLIKLFLMRRTTICIRIFIVIMNFKILLIATRKVLFIIQLLLLHSLQLLVLINVLFVDVFVAVRLLQFFLLLICDLLLDLVLHFNRCLDLAQALH